jgi:hypothetical protein
MSIEVMRPNKILKTTLAAAVLVLAYVKCGSDVSGNNTVDLKDPGRDGNDPVWVYSGLIPKLSDVQLKVSMRGHTVRVIGFAPQGFSQALPDYAVSDQIDGRQRIMVVYPIATVDRSHTRDDGSPARNADVGIYRNVTVFPYNPFGIGSSKTTPWGGFPYIEYERSRNIAFHGPITRSGGLWKLLRGPVSHACNRMQGEHATELAHILGVPMNRRWSASDERPVTATVEVLPHSQYDKIVGGKFDGKFVDVDYPGLNSDIQASKSSPVSTKVFGTWNGLQHPDWICTADAANLNAAKPCAKFARPTPNTPARPSSGGAGPSTETPTTDHVANAKVCNVTTFANVRSDSLSQVIGKAEPDEAIELQLDTKEDDTGRVFVRAWFFENPVADAPAGFGWIARDFTCKN